MILDKHISTIRTLIKEYTDDSLYSDEFLADLLVSTRNAIFEENLKRRKPISRFNYKSFCISLETDNFHDCNCVPSSLGCKVLKSEIIIPKTLLNNKELELNVYSLNGIKIPFKHFSDRKRLSTHPMVSKSVTFDIINGKLVLFGNLNLKKIIVEGLWENPFDLYDIIDCETTTSCWDPLTDEFPMEAQYEVLVYTNMIKLLKINTQQDLSENAQNNTK